MTTESKRLTTKQERFCLEYFTSNNATQAAIKAGYSQKTSLSIGSDNLRNPIIQQRLFELRHALESPSIVSKAERLEKLSELVREGYKTPITAKEKVFAIAEVNKMLGDYAPEQHRIETEVVHTYFFILPDGTKVRPKELAQDAIK